MPPFELHVLGTPRVRGPRGPVDLPLGKPLAALCFVALEPTRVGREDLAGLLWPRSPADRARASVRQAIWLLRKTVDAEIFLEDEDGLRIDRGTLALDLHRLEEELASRELEAAWTRWDGGLLRGFSVPDSPGWQRWSDGVRSVWERRVGEIVEARGRSVQGEERIRWLQRAVEVRPYREEAHALLVDALVESRRVEEAETALHRLRRVTDAPRPEVLRRLEDRIAAARRAAWEDSGDRLQVEFVGRAQEFSVLASLWRSAVSRRPRIGVVTGPAGIGKTRLADELLELARADGAELVESKGVHAECSLELATVGALVRELLHRPGAAGISSGSLQVLQGLVPSANRGGPVPPAPPSVAAVADALLDLTEAVAHETPLVLRVEDLHWVDAPSRNLILRTIRHLRDARVLLVCTCRTEEPDVSALRVVEELASRGLASVVELGPLDPREVREMLGLTVRFADADTATAAAERLHAASAGNPLFLLELLRGLRDDGFLRSVEEPDGTTVRLLDLPRELALPVTVREALDRRLASLGPDARAVALILARAGGPTAPGELPARAGLGEAAGTAALGELLRRDLVRWTRDERLVLAHDSVSDRLRSEEPVQESSVWKGWRRRRSWIVAAAAVLLLLFAYQGVPAGWASGKAVGGGILWVQTSPTRMDGYRAREAPGGRLELDREDSLLAPAGRSFGGPPHWSAEGWRVPGEGHPDLGQPPDGWILGAGGDRRILASPGDDRVLRLLPAGGHALAQIEDEDAPAYRLRLVRVGLDGGGLDSLPAVASAAASPDGRWVAGVLPGPSDSIVVLHPDGARHAAVEVPGGRSAGGPVWCGELGWVGLREREAAGPAPWIWLPGDGPPRPLEIPVPAAWQVACSPDGELLAVLTYEGSRPRLVLFEAGGGEAGLTLPLPRGRRLHWVPDGPVAAPSGVHLGRRTLLLERGERLRAEVRAPGLPGVVPGDRIRWRSRDPLVASVQGDGVVTGNGPGSTWVIAELDRWLRDSVRVDVGEGDPSGRMFSDSLARVDPSVWQVLGSPTPHGTVVDGARVVSMNGDGSRVDGIVTRETFRLDRGATLELDFRLPLTRPDRQSVQLCLAQADPPTGPEAPTDDLGAWVLTRRLCFLWPGDELAARDPTRARFGLQEPRMGPVPVDHALAADGWNRASVQLRPDGQADLLLNGVHIATYMHRVTPEDDPWRILVLGRAADTELHVRNAALWSEALYPVPPRDLP